MTNKDIKKTGQAVVQVLQNSQDETTMRTAPQVDPILVHRPNLLLRNVNRETTRTTGETRVVAVLNSAHLVAVPLHIEVALRHEDGARTARTVVHRRDTTTTEAKEGTKAHNAAQIQKGGTNPRPHLPTH